MCLAELLPTLQALPRGDKLQAIRFLAEELMEEDKLLSLFRPDAIYPIYSPYDSYGAAAIRQRLLEEERSSNNASAKRR